MKTDDTSVNKQKDKEIQELADYLKPKTMKTNWTIFFDKGVMKGFETPNYLKKEADYIDLECFNGALDDAARLSALPVAEESKEKVKYLMYQQYFRIGIAFKDWQPDQTKEYVIEAEFLEEEICRVPCTGECGECIHKMKVLVLSSNH